jgi:hypothetical protein
MVRLKKYKNKISFWICKTHPSESRSLDTSCVAEQYLEILYLDSSSKEVESDQITKVPFTIKN